MGKQGTQNEVAAFLKQNPDIRYVDGIMFDLCGLPLGKRYPVQDLEKLYDVGLTMCASVTLLDASGNTSDPLGYGVSDGDPDAVALPVPGTLSRVPWAKTPTAQVLVDMVHPGSRDPIPFNPREILRRVAGRFQELALTPVIALELEFYLIDLNRSADGEPLPVPSPLTGRPVTGKRVYSTETLEEFDTVLTEISDACAMQGVPATVVSTEFAPGQFEVNLNHVTDPVQAADHACLLRRTVRAVARANGMDATFLSKPFADESGSGLHVHSSFLNDDGQNIFHDELDDGERRIRAAIAGMQVCMFQSMAVFAPNLNAFRRFAPDLFVPVTTDWGYDNRSLAFRIPSARGQGKRIEHRVAGADANPYLALACVLAAAHHGLSNDLSPTSPPNLGNAGEQVDPQMPLTVWDSLAALKEAPILEAYLGRDYLEMYRTVKENEFADLLGTPLPREFEWYL